MWDNSYSYCGLSAVPALTTKIPVHTDLIQAMINTWLCRYWISRFLGWFYQIEIVYETKIKTFDNLLDLKVKYKINFGFITHFKKNNFNFSYISFPF